MISGNAALAAHYGVSPKTIGGWVAYGIPRGTDAKGRNTFETDETDPWVESQRASATTSSNDETRAIRHQLYQQDLVQKEIETQRLRDQYEAERGNILPRDEVETFIRETIEQAQDRFRMIPHRIASLVPEQYREVVLGEAKAIIDSTLIQMAAQLRRGPSEGE